MIEAQWIEIVAVRPDAEECSVLLFELGALGIEIVGPSSVRAFFQNPPDNLVALIEGIGFQVTSATTVAKQNWTGQCPEMWHPVEAGALRIRPVESATAAAALPASPEEIRIIPGLGFGTGHHTATQHVLHLLQEVPRSAVRSALDLGTGSGILAIAISRLFHCPTLAIDNDPLALENAAENIAINHATGITATEGTLEQAIDSFDLIAANLYAELLISLAPALKEKLNPGGFLALSGIAEGLAAEVEAAFGWKALRKRVEGSWVGLLYQKP
ncbi:MAG: methyltransferase domain-containing protein [Proteobacteria bacterium]|nr:methyltransferase domain-containing protein [Pseudomonadota bacterium]